MTNAQIMEHMRQTAAQLAMSQQAIVYLLKEIVASLPTRQGMGMLPQHQHEARAATDESAGSLFSESVAAQLPGCANVCSPRLSAARVEPCAVSGAEPCTGSTASALSAGDEPTPVAVDLLSWARCRLCLSRGLLLSAATAKPPNVRPCVVR
jgi:hypothetical protein